MADRLFGELKSIDEIKKHIAAGIPAKAYLLFGEELYLRELYLGRLKKLLASDEINIVTFSGEFEPGDVADEISGISLFGDRKLILIRDSGYFKKSGGLEFLDGLDGSDASVIFAESDVDRRTASFKAFLKLGLVFEAKQAEASDIRKLLGAEARAAGRTLTPEAAALMIEGITTDITQLLCELEKLILTVPEGGRIEEKHVRAVCCLAPHAGIFDLTGAVSRGDTGTALRLVNALLDGNNKDKQSAVLGILSMLSRNWESLYRTKLMLSDGYSQSDIQRLTGQKAYPVKIQCEQCRRFSLEALKGRIDRIAEFDRDIKTGNIDAVTALTLAVTA